MQCEICGEAGYDQDAAPTKTLNIEDFVVITCAECTRKIVSFAHASPAYLALQIAEAKLEALRMALKGTGLIGTQAEAKIGEYVSQMLYAEGQLHNEISNLIVQLQRGNSDG